MPVLDALPSVRPFAESLYLELHQQPELSFQEHRTAARMAEELRATGVDEVHEGVGSPTAVVGILRNGDGPTVLLRADMDALPVAEDDTVDYRSSATTEVDGAQVPVMHACGHDVHMTGLQASLRLLAEQRDAWSGTIVAVFQPAEELIEGARSMLPALTELVPHIDVALGQHVMSWGASSVLLSEGPVMSAVDAFAVTVHGRGGHGSMPETTIDPIVLAASIVVRLQTIVAREVAPADRAVVTVGTFHAGTRNNIIPDSARFELNVRTYDERVRERVLAAIERIVQAECRAADAPRPADIEPISAGPVTDNDPAVVGRLREAMHEEFGEHLLPADAVGGSEDFSELPRAYGAPYAFWFTGGFDDAVASEAIANGTRSTTLPSNHSPSFVPVMQPTLDTAVRAMTTAALAYLGR